MLVAALIISAMLAYCIGNFSSATLISQTVFKKDIRESGSGSAGATNMFRTFGAKWGFLTLFLDALKAYIAYWLGYAIGYLMTGGENSLTTGAIAGVMVVAGHDWPVLYRFKGGKGIACSLGVMLASTPLIGLGGFAVAILSVLLTNYMSIGSLAGAFFAMVLAIILEPWPLKLMMITLFLLDLIQHRGNIQRLMNGTENPLMSQSLLDKIMGKRK